MFDLVEHLETLRPEGEKRRSLASQRSRTANSKASRLNVQGNISSGDLINHAKSWGDAPCIICGWPLDKTVAVEHIIPFSDRGENTISNIAFSHLKCNQTKSDRSLSFIKEIISYSYFGKYWCSLCKSWKNRSEFYLATKRAYGIEARCKTCDNRRTNDWKRKRKT